ncbi:unnamed protein product [Ostreobium quekettii]|uniref:PX domain-containing protein n=1 Tax=Ostreobium quekettii TaxID=121088 RepID=A0A8S1J7P3_9CHLO|nr:unnamed protein product [Ostreobium quekettii]
MAGGWRYSVRIPDYTKESTQGEDDVVGWVAGAQYYQVDVLVQPPGSSEPAAPSTVWRRFSEFRQLHTNLKSVLPNLFKSKELDPPPRMSLRFVNNSDRLLNERRQGLESWLWVLMSNQRIAQSQEIRAFLQLHLAVRAATTSSSGYGLFHQQHLTEDQALSISHLQRVVKSLMENWTQSARRLVQAS